MVHSHTRFAGMGWDGMDCVGNSMYFNGGVHTLSYQPILSQCSVSVNALLLEICPDYSHIAERAITGWTDREQGHYPSRDAAAIILVDSRLQYDRVTAGTILFFQTLNINLIQAPLYCSFPFWLFLNFMFVLCACLCILTFNFIIYFSLMVL